ncbi:uncharacterized protein LOC142606168 [Castanea sativa]|uniref:uncharacterized protein LOC142606168 n=1 Tax=Castanea sativa TaxID=21020 RepID=UPI003F64A0E9
MNIEEQRTAAEPVERLEEVQLDDSRIDRTTRIGTSIDQMVRHALLLFLKENQDVFAWSHDDMPGIDPSVIVHKLNVSPSFSPVRQKKRVFALEWDRAAAEEVQKLREANFIREVYYPDWLANVVMVKKTVKEVQSLTGKIAALNRFVSRAMDKCLPFFKTLRRSFKWTDECQKAFEELKAYLSAPPLLSPSTPGEELFMYLAVSSAAVSAALIREEGKIQKPVYFVSRALRGAGERYPRMEKLAFALITAARKLKPYFQAHPIIVLMDQPLRRAMNNPKASGRMALWATELSEYDIRYQPRKAMKGQILADFIVEFTTTEEQGVEETPTWRIHIDGSSNKHVGGVGVVLHAPEGDKIECMIRLEFPTTNNEAEYEALVAGLELAIAAGARKAVVYSDSQVVASQINGSYECRNECMRRYLGEVKELASNLQFTWVEAEALATITEKNIRGFVWKSIVCRYGIPRVLVSNNRKQFDNDAF